MVLQEGAIFDVSLCARNTVGWVDTAEWVNSEIKNYNWKQTQ